MVFIKLKKAAALAACGAAVWCVTVSLIHSKEAMLGISSGIARCLDVIVPSLFGMMLLSQLLISSRLYHVLSSLFYPISKWLFGLPKQLFPVFLISNIAGYPVGAKMLLQLQENGSIDKKTAEVMAVCCYGSGPAFILGVIGVGIFSNLTLGMTVFISCAAANAVAAFIIGRFFKPKCAETDSSMTFSPKILVDSVASSGNAMLMICLMIISFSYFLSIADSAGLLRIFAGTNTDTGIRTFLEISNISSFRSDLRLLPLMTALISFGGICVHMQLLAITKNKFSLKKFFIFRLPISILAGIINFVIITQSNFAEYAFAQAAYSSHSLKNSVFSGICLIFMIITIIFSKKTSNPKKSVI